MGMALRCLNCKRIVKITCNQPELIGCIHFCKKLCFIAYVARMKAQVKIPHLKPLDPKKTQ